MAYQKIHFVIQMTEKDKLSLQKIKKKSQNFVELLWSGYEIYIHNCVKNRRINHKKF